jgi:hypothetical protein
MATRKSQFAACAVSRWQCAGIDQVSQYNLGLMLIFVNGREISEPLMQETMTAMNQE